MWNYDGLFIHFFVLVKRFCQVCKLLCLGFWRWLQFWAVLGRRGHETFIRKSIKGYKSYKLISALKVKRMGFISKKPTTKKPKLRCVVFKPFAIWKLAIICSICTSAAHLLAIKGSTPFKSRMEFFIFSHFSLQTFSTNIFFLIQSLR